MKGGEKMKKSRIIAILAVISTLCVFLTACGSKKASTSDQGTTKTPVKISFWTGLAGPYEKNLNKIITDFNNSQKKYKVVATSQETYDKLNQKVMAAAKSNSLPVLGMASYTSLPDYKNNGFIENLDAMYKGMSASQKKDIYSAFLSGSKIGNSYYSIPFSKSTRVMYVNEDILKKYNLEIPKTWEQMRKDGEVLKEHGIYAYGFDQSFQMEWEGLLHAAGVTPITSTGKVNLSSSKAVTAANFVLDMIKDGTAKSAGSDIYWTNSFVNGKSAFYIGSSAGMTAIKQVAPSSLNWTTAVVPSYEGKSGTEVAGNDIVLFKGASQEQKQGAYAFMKYLLTSKATTKWAMLTGYVPLTKSAVKSKEYQAFLKSNKRAKAAVESLPDSFSTKSFVGYNEYYTDELNAFDSMLTKQTPAKDALTNLAKQAKKIISDNKNN
ncbi:sugar ABC transporter substrate-binding protein [Liquorilactobacillus mali]|uniref:Sugar ABC transporter substrate-binding protein n=2 Tax=Liquorilactobacillus mali TaxID=1618 RepID=A0A0R2FUV9_9LACO|nr:sugar ABC transporter substrate-binding protein [Liquorilactobacillus mali]